MSYLVDGWLESASGDLQNIEYIIKDENLTHIVAFHSQQCVEKSFKALLEYKNQEVPKQHSTLTLYGLVSEFIDILINEEVLSAFDDLYIDSRYPGNFGLLPYGKPTLDDAREFYELAVYIYEYIRKKV
ncbi:HEPN domain-containing protein [bacterium]|nr:HEPN domain-containing protein [bacterium]MBU1957817.1 HEPN domain-containing protein [bacterium]